MKVCLKSFFLSVLMSLVALVSCVQEANDGSQRLNGTIADLSGQVASVSVSLEQLNVLQNVVEQDLSELSADLEAHIGYLKSGVSRMDGTMATLQLQKQVAMVVAELQAAGFESSLTQFVKSVKSWLGKSFETYFDVLVYGCTSQALVEGAALQLSEQHSYVDAVLSDVEAGLRDGVPASELSSVLETLVKNLASATELTSQVDEIVLDLETECAMAVEALFDESSSYDASALKKAATQARIQLKSSEVTISDLVARIETIEKEVAKIQANISGLRADVDELLGMIQSLTFVSEYSDDKAVAYYRMTEAINQERYSEGKKERVPQETFDLTFLVRPAAVADALAESWQNSNSLSVIGYYANRIQQQATTNIQAFEIENAVSTTGKGLLTVTVKNAFDDEFYFKEKGAMLALAVESGKNNCVSKFVEIVPRDITGKIYAESLELTPTSLSIQNGETYQLVAKVTPSNVTDQGCTWDNYGSAFFTIDNNGKITGTKVGKSPVYVYANATDEFGRQLSAMCDVDVTPAIRILGSDAVEMGETIVLEIESPMYIDPKYLKWELESPLNEFYATVVDNKNSTCSVTGNVAYFTNETADGGAVLRGSYKAFNVKCTIEGAEQTVLYHPIRVIYPQPKSIEIEGLYNDVDELRLKKGVTYQLNATIKPDNVDMEKFKLDYLSGWKDIATVDFNTGLLNTVGFGATQIKVEVRPATTDNFFYPYRDEFVRTLNLVVEPYWVETMTLPDTYKMAPDAVATLTPDWTSDVEGVAPSDQKLVWTSDNPSVVSVDETTGEMTAHKEGTATITATTAGSNSVPSGSEQKSSSCYVTVELPSIPINIGDYYYSDGTWSTTRDYGKTVIGVVFAKVDATASDLRLRTDYPTCNHGLVLGLTEYNSIFGLHTYDDIYDYASCNFYERNGWPITPREDAAQTVMGYTHTLALEAYREYRGAGDWVQLVTILDGLSNPTGGTSWYIPSFAEMKLIDAEVELINQRLNAVSGTRIMTDGKYWPSTLMKGPKYKNLVTQPFNMNTGTWNNADDNWDNEKSKSYPVRVVFAF